MLYSVIESGWIFYPRCCAHAILSSLRETCQDMGLARAGRVSRRSSRLDFLIFFEILENPSVLLNLVFPLC